VGVSSHFTATDRLVALTLACQPREFTIDEIAFETALGQSTVRAALPRLVTEGLIERTNKKPARYRVPGEEAGNGSQAATVECAVSPTSPVASPPLAFAVEEVGGGANCTQGGVGSHDPKRPGGAPAPPSTSLAFSVEPEKPKRARKRDLVFEALVEFSDADENVDRGKLNTACKKIRGFCEGQTDAQIVSEIAMRAPLMRAKADTWPEPTLMPHHYAEWWTRVLARRKPASQAFKCPICTAPFASANAVAEHVARIHG
jgi:hypothetical protein